MKEEIREDDDDRFQADCEWEVPRIDGWIVMHQEDFWTLLASREIKMAVIEA